MGIHEAGQQSAAVEIVHGGGVTTVAQDRFAFANGDDAAVANRHGVRFRLGVVDGNDRAVQPDRVRRFGGRCVLAPRQGRQGYRRQ